MGVFDDLTTTSATSASGMAFRRPRGGVGRVEAPGDGPENILVVSVALRCPMRTHIQTASAMPSSLLSVLRFLSASCCSATDICGLILSKFAKPTEEPSVAVAPPALRALMRSIMACLRCSTDPVRTILPLEPSAGSSSTNGSSRSGFFGIDVRPGAASSFEDDADGANKLPEDTDAAPRCGRGKSGIGGMFEREEPLVEGVGSSDGSGA